MRYSTGIATRACNHGPVKEARGDGPGVRPVTKSLASIAPGGRCTTREIDMRISI